MLNTFSLDTHVFQAGTMNNRNLSVGQGMPSDIGRRRLYNQHQHQNQYSQQTLYTPPPYVPPFCANYYSLLPQYLNSPAQYQAFGRPPPMQQFVAPLIPPQQPPYSRSHQSPVSLSSHRPPLSPNQPSTRSSNTVSASLTPTTTEISSTVPTPSTEPDSPAIPFRVPLPWYSNPGLGWPARRSKKKRKPAQKISVEAVKLPNITKGFDVENLSSTTTNNSITEVATNRPETPSTNQHASEEISTNPSTPSSNRPYSGIVCGSTPTAKVTHKSTNRPVPVTPALPRSNPHDTAKCISENEEIKSQVHQNEASDDFRPITKSEESPLTSTEAIKTTLPVPAKQAWTTPKQWTGIFNPGIATLTKTSSENDHIFPALNSENKGIKPLADALKLFNVNSNGSKVTFLEPRGLVNTGNMCYMNSILQALIFCSPFFNFLDQMSKRAAFSFKSETPLLDAMILVMREYSVIDSAISIEKLRMRLKEPKLRQFGEPFTPDFFYNVINQIPRFSSMRGHQQDAEEFLGFLLEGLHDECVKVMRSAPISTNSIIPDANNSILLPSIETGFAEQTSLTIDQEWLEVGPKQKAVVTRSLGFITVGSPVTKIFGGNLRSEFRVPGLKDSVTLEPYQPLQLDIGMPNVHSIIDALKGLTRSESLHGNFKSPKGPNVTAVKQVFIETLPPVLILHLKRFQYDNTGGTQKIWKKVGYPLELELPKEVFPRHKRAEFGKNGLPKYQLISAVYHHGKNASGGHYTVDVRRQDGYEWIRIDDTLIRKIRSDEVAELGNEEDPKALTSTLNTNKKKETFVPGRGFSALPCSEKDSEDDGWKQASGSGKKWSGVVNGSSASKAKSEKLSIKDNKVAYILFYQKI